MGNLLSCRSSLSCIRDNKDEISANPNSIITQRENMATWYRVNIAVTDVYEIIKTLGKGAMGEVYHVRRKDGGRTHTEETKRKEEEAASIHSASQSLHGVDSLDESTRSYGGMGIGGMGKRGRGRNRSTNDLLDISSMGSDRSRSPFSRLKRKRIDKKNSETLAMLGATGLGLDGSMNGSAGSDENKRRNPPDLTKVLKPIPILRKPSHVPTPNNNQVRTLTEDDTSTGMTTLITGKVLLYDNNDNGNSNDSDDDSIPMNINAISQDPSHSKSISNSKSNSDSVVKSVSTTDVATGTSAICCNHTTFSMPMGDDDVSVNSAVSEVTYGEDSTPKKSSPSLNDSVITGDNGHPLDKTGEAKNGAGPKKWVPRRRVFFRRHYACKTIATENIKKAQMEELLNEIYMMRKMDHPYIIRLYEVYQVQRKYQFNILLWSKFWGFI
jgi:serine/threonine protein kinase